MKWNIQLNRAHDRIDDTGVKYHVPEYTETQGIPLQFKVMYYIALFAGLRKGELVALTWNDVDFNNNTININKSTATIKGEQITKAPKNKTSIREVTIPGLVVEL
ncbi:tyrosine-type recombinase/integrase [Anaerocolumna aminovalerica]|uniref:tyrosine-type recombinase/integrase n=1 Tax=Anaerocolumna aminovalerica TaxID=1527 RepID=UPI001C0F0ACE|nr:tyrosine-type recombinase/integrase [Anaerocolumna aminovalerica]MBU5332404.1 tyrosine-type recombinase/integrase [Anaerocolumna aminovalerica]